MERGGRGRGKREQEKKGKTVSVKNKKQAGKENKNQHAEHAEQGHTEATHMLPTVLYMKPRVKITWHVTAYYKAMAVISPISVMLINL